MQLSIHELEVILDLHRAGTDLADRLTAAMLELPDDAYDDDVLRQWALVCEKWGFK